MFESRIRLMGPVIAAALVAGALAGCSHSEDGPDSPPPPTTVMKPLFHLDPANSIVALPSTTDIWFSGSTDGTLNMPALSIRPLASALNALDGWSTTAPITVSFSSPLDEDSLALNEDDPSASGVTIVEMYLSNTTKAPAQGAELPPGVTSPIIRVLEQDTDFSVGISDAIDSRGDVLVITPLKPLRPSVGTTNIGYIVLLTDAILNADGTASTPDDQYAAYKSAPNDCSSFTDATNIGLCLLTKAHLQIGNAVGVSPASVALSFSFTTQSVDNALTWLAANTTAQPITVMYTGQNTQQADPRLQGKANVYAGATTVPYYLTPASSTSDKVSVLQRWWTAAGGANVTRFNPVPEKKADVKIPVVVTVPNANANTTGGGCTKPAAGWPVAIVQHGITGNRTQALAMADSYADACFVVVAIDLPLHGLTPNYSTTPATTSPLYCSSTTANPICMGAIERTFDVDLINNTSSAATADGKIDTSGAHYINLSSPLTSRDNNRQSASDLNVLSKSVTTMDLTGDGVSDIDPARVHLTGLSLGAMMGTVASKFTDFATVTASAPGGLITQLLLDSQTFGPRIKAGLSASLVIDSSVYNLFVSDLQAAIDSSDPVNHVAGAQANNPYHLQKIIGDAVVPNSATDRMIDAGGLTKLTTLGAHPVAAGDGAYTAFTQGSHGTLFDPTASLLATIEAQSEAVKFGATEIFPGEPLVVLGDDTVLDLD